MPAQPFIGAVQAFLMIQAGRKGFNSIRFVNLIVLQKSIPHSTVFAKIKFLREEFIQ
jgi:hypothetical protein